MRKPRTKDVAVRIAEAAGEAAVAAVATLAENIGAGITCPHCHNPMRVYRTKSLTGAVLRERICPVCRHKKETTEEAEPEAELRSRVIATAAKADQAGLRKAEAALRPSNG